MQAQLTDHQVDDASHAQRTQPHPSGFPDHPIAEDALTHRPPLNIGDGDQTQRLTVAFDHHDKARSALLLPVDLALIGPDVGEFLCRSDRQRRLPGFEPRRILGTRFLDAKMIATVGRTDHNTVPELHGAITPRSRSAPRRPDSRGTAMRPDQSATHRIVDANRQLIGVASPDPRPAEQH